MKQYFAIFLFCSSSLLFFISCGNSGTGSTPKGNIDLSIYETSAVPGTSWKKVNRNHPSGDVYEEGFVENGNRVGTWIAYYPEDGYPQILTSYVQGQLNGPYIEWDKRGKLVKQANYLNGQLDGLYIEYTAGRPTRKIQYTNGAVNGFMKEFNSAKKLVKESYFKNNQLDGTVKHFNDEGKVIMQYEYKNGNKISGGIVE